MKEARIQPHLHLKPGLFALMGAALFLSFVLPREGRAETVYLANGRKIPRVTVEIDETEVIVLHRDGRKERFASEEVKRVAFEEDPERPAQSHGSGATTGASPPETPDKPARASAPEAPDKPAAANTTEATDESTGANASEATGATDETVGTGEETGPPSNAEAGETKKTPHWIKESLKQTGERIGRETKSLIMKTGKTLHNIKFFFLKKAKKTNDSLRKGSEKLDKTLNQELNQESPEQTTKGESKTGEEPLSPTPGAEP